MSDAALQIFRDYQPLALQIASSFLRRVPSSVLISDLQAAAQLGLWKSVLALMSRDFKEGHFDSYVRIRIRGAIQDELRSQDRLPRRFRRGLVDSGEQVSFLSDDDAAHELLAPAVDIDAELDVHAELLDLRRAYDQLRPRLRYVLQEYLNGKPQRQIAHEMSISEPRVCQLLARAKGKLREIIRRTHDGSCPRSDCRQARRRLCAKPRRKLLCACSTSPISPMPAHACLQTRTQNAGAADPTHHCSVPSAP